MPPSHQESNLYFTYNKSIAYYTTLEECSAIVKTGQAMLMPCNEMLHINK